MPFKRDFEEIVLPKCQEKYTIRALNGNDWAMTTGRIPDRLDNKKPVEEMTVKDLDPKTRAEDLQYTVEMACRGIVKAPPGLDIWPKEPKATPAGYISFYELSEEDQDFLIAKVFEKSVKAAGGDGEQAERFPEKQTTSIAAS